MDPNHDDDDQLLTWSTPEPTHYFSAEMNRYRALDLAIRAGDSGDNPERIVARADKFLAFLDNSAAPTPAERAA